MTNYNDDIANRLRWIKRKIDGKDKLILQFAVKNGAGYWVWQDVPVVEPEEERPIT